MNHYEPDQYHFYEPKDGHRLSRDPLRAILGPRPIGWISTKSAGGIHNIAPYSFFTMVSDTPPIVAFSSMGWKDTVKNVEATGEFICNLATRPLADAMNLTSADIPSEASEFEFAALPVAFGSIVDCPLVAAGAVALECRLTESIQLKNAAGEPTQGFLTMGEIVGVHIAKTYLADGRFDPAAAQIIQRAGYGADYFQVMPEGRFSMHRPKRG